MIIAAPPLTGEDPTNISRVPEQQAQQSVAQKPLDPNRPDLQPYLLSLLEQVRADGRQEKIRRLRKWVRNSKFYEGEHYGYISPHTGRWIDVDVSAVDSSQDADDDLQFVNNQFRFYAKSIRKEWVRATTTLRVTAKSDKTDKIGAAEFSNDIVTDKQSTLLDETAKQSEGMFALLYGNYFRYSYYSTDIIGGVERIPIFEKTVVKTGPDGMSCNDCLHEFATPDEESSETPVQDGSENEAQEGASCPVCQSPNVQLQEGPAFETMAPTGEYQEYKVGDVFTEIPNPMEINVHLHARNLSQTPYLHRERLILRSVLKSKFKNASLQGGQSDGQPDASSYIRQLESAIGNTGSPSNYAANSGVTNSPFEPLKFDQLWLDVVVYADYVTKQEEKISDGTVIPAGTSLAEAFPRGLYIAAVGKEILNLRNENKLSHWAHGVYDLIPSRFWGDGIEDMVELQRQLNEVINLRFENMMANAAPNTIFNPLKIDSNGFSGKPRELSALLNASVDDDIRKFVLQLPGQGLDRENFGAEENYKKDMQSLSGAFSINSGMPDVDISTATGARIIRDAAISMLGPALAIKAKVDVEWAYQVLKLCQAYWTAERYVPHAGNHTQLTGQWFKASDVEGDFEIVYVPGSFMPRSEMEEREDFISFISPTVTGLPLGFLNPMVPANVKAFAAEKFRVPIDLDETRVDTRIAQGRIEKLQAAAKDLILQGVLDPEYDFDAAQQAAQQALQVAAPVQPPPAPAPAAPPQEAAIGPGAGPAQAEPTPVSNPGDLPMQPLPMIDPNIMALQQLITVVPVKIVVDEHMAFVTAYRNFLKTDDGINSPTAVQKVLEMKIAQHYLAGAQVQGYLAGLANAMTGLTALPGTSFGPASPAAPPQPSPQGNTNKVPPGKAPEASGAYSSAPTATTVEAPTPQTA